MFKKGDAIIHPVRGAGVIEHIVERSRRGDTTLFYKIKLLSQPGTNVMIPVNAAEGLGLRPAIRQSELNRIWRVLRDSPHKLPTDHKARYRFLEDKLRTGDVLKVAEVVKDMAWRRQEEGRLTTVGKRIYEEGVMLLAGEIAAAQGTDLADAEAEVRGKLRDSLSLTPVMAS